MNLKPGRYSCIVLAPNNGWFGEAGDNATPFIRIPLQVSKGPQRGEEVDYSAWISDKAIERTIKNLREVFQWDGDLVALARQVNTGPFVGRECSITVEEEEFKPGKFRAVIKWLNGPDGGNMMAIDRALALARRLTGIPDPTPEEIAAARPRSSAPPNTDFDALAEEPDRPF